MRCDAIAETWTEGARARGEEQTLMLWVVGGGRMTKGGDASRSVLKHDGHLPSADLILSSY